MALGKVNDITIDVWTEIQVTTHFDYGIRLYIYALGVTDTNTVQTQTIFKKTNSISNFQNIGNVFLKTHKPRHAF